MNKHHRGFIVSLLLLVIAALILGGGAYVYKQSKQQGNSIVSASTTTSTTTSSSTTTTQTPDNSNISNPNMSGDVPGMTKYTDSNFGFSFWYPSSWQVSVQTNFEGRGSNGYGSGVLKKRVILSDRNSVQVSIDEVYSPQLSITDSSNCGPASNCPLSVRYYFDTKINHTWTVQKDNNPPTLPDFTVNTMGGLHMFPGNARGRADTIIPLAADKFLVLWSSDPNNIGTNYQDYLGRTIVALDPAVATPVSGPEQMKTIQAEAAAYGEAFTNGSNP